jgi:hypothetical protein
MMWQLEINRKNTIRIKKFGGKAFSLLEILQRQN